MSTSWIDNDCFTFSKFQLLVKMHLFSLAFLRFIWAFVEQMYLHLLFHDFALLLYPETFVCLFLLLSPFLIWLTALPVIWSTCYFDYSIK